MIRAGPTPPRQRSSKRAVSRRVCISATFTAEPIQAHLELLCRRAGVPAGIEFAPYNQVFPQLLDPGSAMAQNSGGANLLLVRLEDWMGHAGHEWDPGVPAAAERMQAAAREFLDALRQSCERCPAPHLVFLCPESEAAAASASYRAVHQAVGDLWDEAIARIPGAHWVRPEEIARLYPVRRHDDPASNRLGHIPYTTEYYAALGLMAARRLYSFWAPPKKVIVLDCDNTLWSGVAGEDGPMGVTIDPFRRHLQEFMVDRSRQGFVLCLSSKNVEEDVFAVFEQRPEMPLRLDQIAAHRINWQPKSENLASLAEELNLGIDSFIFVDDDPAVCAEVGANRPEVLTVHLPAEASRIPSLLDHIWAFDRFAVTKEDLQRTESYKHNAQRERIRKSASSFQDYLAGLELRIDSRPLDGEDLGRAAQLTQRTNQFNCTTIRRTEAELGQLWRGGLLEGLTVRVSDRFGDYGLVGLALYKTEGADLVVDTFLMSCRTLGRGVEHRMIAVLGEIALQRGCRRVAIPFVPTAKNLPARDFLAASFPEHVQEQEEGRRVFCPPAPVAAALAARPSVEVPQEAGSASAAAPAPAAHVNWAELAYELCQPRQLAAATALVAGAGERPAYAAPVSDLEKHVARVWEELFHLSPIGREDDFFQLGGDSFLAVRMFSQIEAESGIAAPLTALFEASSVARLAALLGRGEAVQWPSLVPIQPNGSRPPLYLVHAAGGNVLFYRDLVPYLPPDQPLYGLQAQGLGGKGERHRRVEDMAAHYIGEIRRLQPEGPYYLGGSSFGGLVAYEMGRQLRAAGHSVALIALFDTYGKGYPRYRSTGLPLRGLLRFTDRIRHHWRNLALLSGRQKWDYIAVKRKKAGKLLERRVRAKKDEIQQQYRAMAGADLGEPLQKTQNAIQEALERYSYPPIDGPVTLFRAEQQPAGVEPDPELGWKSLIRGELTIIDVPGAHGAVTVEPHARFLAAKLVPVLDRLHAVDTPRDLTAA